MRPFCQKQFTLIAKPFYHKKIDLKYDSFYITNMSTIKPSKYQKTDRQHILDAPDTYVGSVEDRI